MNKQRNCFGLLLDLLLIATKRRMKSQEKKNLCYEGRGSARHWLDQEKKFTFIENNILWDIFILTVSGV